MAGRSPTAGKPQITVQIIVQQMRLLLLLLRMVWMGDDTVRISLTRQHLLLQSQRIL